MLVLFYPHRGKKVSHIIARRSSMLIVRPVGRIVLTPVRLIRQISPREKADRIRNPLLWERLSSRDKCLALLSDELRRGGNHPTYSLLLNPQSAFRNPKSSTSNLMPCALSLTPIILCLGRSSNPRPYMFFHIRTPKLRFCRVLLGMSSLNYWEEVNSLDFFK
jgi:hypothetical protein